MIDDTFTEEEVVYDVDGVKIVESDGEYARWWELFIDGKKVWENGYIE